jgi:predicted RNA polymerase sigma factor
VHESSVSNRPEHGGCPVDLVRADAFRRSREENSGRARGSGGSPAELGDEFLSDDAHNNATLSLLVLWAHPAATPSSQVALMLRAVAGLTREIGEGVFVPEAAMAQRIRRALRPQAGLCQQVTGMGALAKIGARSRPLFERQSCSRARVASR